jgi:hypothetical protein
MLTSDSIQVASGAGNIRRAMISDWSFPFTSLLGENKIVTQILNTSYNNQVDLEKSCESMHV